MDERSGSIGMTPCWSSISASASASHTFNSGFNLPGTASYIANNSIRTLNPAGNVMIESIMLPGPALRGRRVPSAQPPPNEVSTATPYTVSQTGTSALIKPDPNLRRRDPPTVTATWITLPKHGQPGVIQITRDGVGPLVTIPVPPLTTHTPNTLAPVAQPLITTAFATQTIPSWLADARSIWPDMRRLVLLILVLIAAGPATAPSPGMAFTPPAGWTKVERDRLTIYVAPTPKTAIQPRSSSGPRGGSREISPKRLRNTAWTPAAALICCEPVT